MKPPNWPAATYSNQMITTKKVSWTQNPRYETVTHKIYAYASTPAISAPMYICPPSSDQVYDARQVHTSATTPHKEGEHAPAQSTSLDGLTATSTSQLCPVDTDPLLVNIRPEVNNSPHSLLGLCDFENKHLCNTRVNKLSTVLHQNNSHCVDENVI